MLEPNIFEDIVLRAQPVPFLRAFDKAATQKTEVARVARAALELAENRLDDHFAARVNRAALRSGNAMAHLLDGRKGAERVRT